jgi:single-strand DNA-binding protein
VSKSLNRVTLIGNLVKDPELRYTPNGTPICNIVVATDRQWTVGTEKKTETEFHRIVAWSKLAEICSKFLKKGTKVYISGRMSTRSYEKDGEKKFMTEVVMEDMITLSANPHTSEEGDPAVPSVKSESVPEDVAPSDVPF